MSAPLNCRERGFPKKRSASGKLPHFLEKKREKNVVLLSQKRRGDRYAIRQPRKETPWPPIGGGPAGMCVLLRRPFEITKFPSEKRETSGQGLPERSLEKRGRTSTISLKGYLKGRGGQFP